VWCFPIFLLIVAGLILWGVWRWLRIQQNNQIILENPVERLPASVPEIIDLPQDDDDALPHIESDFSNNSYPLTKPDDQVRRWLEEVKRKLLRSDRKVEDDDTDD
jgi:hypothetical protein